MISKIAARTQKAVKIAFNKIERSERNIFETMKSLTSDNGCDFLNFEELEK